MDGAGGGAATPTTRGRGPGAPALAAHHAALRWRQTALRDGVLREPACGGRALGMSGGGC